MCSEAWIQPVWCSRLVVRRTSTERNRYFLFMYDINKQCNITCIVCAYLLVFSVDKTSLHHVSTQSVSGVHSRFFQAGSDSLTARAGCAERRSFHCTDPYTSSPPAVLLLTFIHIFYASTNRHRGILVCGSYVKMWLYAYTWACSCLREFTDRSTGSYRGPLPGQCVSLTGRSTLWPLTGSEWQIKGPCLCAHLHHGTRRRSRENERERPAR